MENVPESVRGFLASLSEALALPAPDVSSADRQAYAWQLEDRAMFVRGAIEDVLAGNATLGLDWEADQMRRIVAKRPPTYRTLPSDTQDGGQA